jgi:K+-sensing histidine kinase KdpD
MGSDTTRTGPFSSPIFCLLLAIVLTLAFTVARAVLIPVLGPESPYMLYVAAVLIAGFARGALCGFLVMLGGGAAGLVLFSGWDRSLDTAARPLVALVVFLIVAALVLMMSNELRRHANLTFERLRGRVAASRNAPQSGDGAVTQRAA